MECDKSRRVESGTFAHASLSCHFSSFMVLGIGSLYANSFIILQSFPIKLISGELAGHSTFSIKLGNLFSTMFARP